MKKHIRPCICETCEKARWSESCVGICNHDSFYKTVVGSPQWQLWEKEIARRMAAHNKKKSKIYTGCWDVDECLELGRISQDHWIDFCKYIIDNRLYGKKRL